MKETQILLAALAFAMIIACAKKNSASTPPGQVVEVADISQTPNFEAQQLVTRENESSYQNYLERRFGSSCQVRRDHKGRIQSYQDRKIFDPSLNDGDSTFVSTQVSNQSGMRKIEERYQVRNSRDLNARVIKTIFSMVIPGAGGEIMLKPMPEAINCVVMNGEIDCSGENKSLEDYRPNITQRGYDFLRSDEGGQFETCYIQNASKVVTKTEKGIFRLHEGGSFEAMRETEFAFGPVICGKQNLGEGEVTTTTITSLSIKAIPGIEELQSASFYTCGGVQVLKSHVVKVGGKIVDSFRFEQLKPVLK